MTQAVTRPRADVRKLTMTAMLSAVATVLIGSAAMLLIFVPLAVRKFESVSSR